MSRPSREFLRGVYVSPAAVRASPDHARELVEGGGVNLFVVRAGFDPSGHVR